MDNLGTEGYIQRFERACLEERPRAALAVRVAAEQACRAERDRAVWTKPSGIELRPLRRDQGVLTMVESWLQRWAKRVTRLAMVRRERSRPTPIAGSRGSEFSAVVRRIAGVLHWPQRRRAIPTGAGRIH